LVTVGTRAVPREREIGVVLAVTPTGNLTLRSASKAVAPEGTMALDRTGREIGRVSRVFGPVAHPFLSVRPRMPLRPLEAAALIGSTLRRG
jgi:rRNA processing protein Gar1